MLQVTEMPPCIQGFLTFQKVEKKPQILKNDFFRLNLDDFFYQRQTRYDIFNY